MTSSQVNLAEIFNPNAQGFSATNMAYLAHCAQAIYKLDIECTELIKGSTVVDRIKRKLNTKSDGTRNS